MPYKKSRWDLTRARKLKALGAMPALVRQKVKPALEKAAKRINALQKAAVPKDTGALALNISYSLGKAPQLSSSASFSNAGKGSMGGDADLSAWIYAGTEDKRAKGWYARFVEFGTAPHGNHPGTAAQPFFYPAIRLLRKPIVRNLQRAFNSAIKEAGISSNAPRGRHVAK